MKCKFRIRFKQIKISLLISLLSSMPAFSSEKINCSAEKCYGPYQVFFDGFMEEYVIYATDLLQERCGIVTEARPLYEIDENDIFGSSISGDPVILIFKNPDEKKFKNESLIKFMDAARAEAVMGATMRLTLGPRNSSLILEDRELWSINQGKLKCENVGCITDAMAWLSDRQLGVKCKDKR